MLYHCCSMLFLFTFLHFKKIKNRIWLDQNCRHYAPQLSFSVCDNLCAFIVNMLSRFQGHVESWLAQLLKVTRLSVHDIIRSASFAITDTNFKLMEFEKAFPAQVCDSLLLLYCHYCYWMDYYWMNSNVTM